MRLHLLNIEEIQEVTILSIEEENKSVVEEAAASAEAEPDPDPKTATLFVTPPESDVDPQATVPATDGKPITLREGINETLKHEFRRNPNTFLWGQDVASKEKGGVFNVTKGMQKEFGNRRVLNSPLAEDFIIG